MECWKIKVKYNGKRVKNTMEHFLVMREMERVLIILQMAGLELVSGAMMFKMVSVVTNYQVV